MAGYDEEVEVTASITDLYAAPELAHKANRKEVMATPSVDYFALGITMFELWLGEKPFKGVRDSKRDDLIREGKVDLPIDMPSDYAAIIQGLIKPLRKDRWGNEHVRKWLKGEALAIDSNASQKVSTNYDPLKFSNTESAVTPKELAVLMEKYPDIGKTCLYDGIIKTWLQKAGDLMLYNEIQNIMSRYAADKDAGLYTAILALDPERPFKSRSGKVCKTTEDIADAIMAESAYYMEDLKNPNANLYLYLAATEGSQGKEAADIFYKYFKEYSPKRALTLLYLKLQSDGGITIGSKHYQSPDELKQEKDGAQIALIKKAVTKKDSMLLVWLSDIYGDNLKSTDTFNKLSIPEQFFLFGLLPFHSFKELNDSNLLLQDLIDSYPGRTDLFEIYAAQGLPLTGQSCNDKKTPIDYAACNFNELSKKHGVDTIRNMLRLLCKLGADVNEYSGDGTCPLINAYNAKDNDLVKLLLELGADENQYRVYKERIEEQERIERERREEEKRKEQEYYAEIRNRIAKYKNWIAANSEHTVGLKSDGTVVAVGDNEYDQCDTGSWRDIAAVAAGSYHTVGLKSDGTVVAVGSNDKGQCNTGSWRDIAAVAAGRFHTVGLKSDGTVVAVGKCYVYNAGTDKFDYFDIDVSNWRDIAAIATSSWHTIGLKSDSTVVAVGDNKHGQCNTGNWRDIAAIATGVIHTVGLKSDGTVVAVGNNDEGQCDTGSWRDIVAVAVSAHTVGLKSDGTVVAVGKCYVYNKGTEKWNYLDIDVSGWRDIVAIATSSAHTVGLKSDGTVVAVGDNQDGQCKTGSWRDIGPVSEEKHIEWKRRAKQEHIEQQRKEQERIAEQRLKEQSMRWQQQGLCRYCGGKLGGIFTKKCKSCGEEN
jgi:alpha-tubulin suppressor-like RCC1 family protein